jgi:tetratricopeptide (TPR) repeat protein
MGRLTAYLLKSFRQWERSTRIAFAIALALLLMAFILLLLDPSEVRQPALIGAVGLILATQFIFMWGNRHMVTPFTQAQRHYLAEDFHSARAILEELRVEDRADANALTLLANTYRQLGMLNESEEVVKKAIEIRPFDPFPLYGFGRTLLVKGLYKESAVILRQALEAGAPPLIHFDLGEALYRQGLVDEARNELIAAGSSPDDFRELMRDYLLYCMGAHEKPTREVVQAGIAYWQDHAERFRQTPYGQALADDVRQMQPLMEEI